jgi:hypothetical protein
VLLARASAASHWNSAGMALICGCIVCTFAALGRWKRTFDRSPQVVIDERGIKTKRFGHIRWHEVKSAQLGWQRSGLALTVRFSSPEPWRSRLNWFVRKVYDSQRSPNFAARIALTNMSVNEVALRCFINEMTRASARTA